MILVGVAAADEDDDGGAAGEDWGLGLLRETVGAPGGATVRSQSETAGGGGRLRRRFRGPEIVRVWSGDREWRGRIFLAVRRMQSGED